MHALNRSDLMPVIAEYHPRRSDGRRAFSSRSLIRPGHSWQAAPDAGKPTGNRPQSSYPAEDHSGIWLRNAAAGLCLLAAAAAVVSFTAQYRLIQATRRLAVVAGLEAAIPDAAALVFACLGIALALHGRRAIRARALNLAAVGDQRVHERHRGRARLAEPGHLGHAPGRVRPGQRHSDRRRPVLGPGPPPAPGQPPGRRPGHPAGHPRRPDPVAAAPDPSPRLHPGRVPRLGPGRMPGRPRPPRPRPQPGPRRPPRRTWPGSRGRRPRRPASFLW